jgi:hypothetical protein
LDGPASTKLLDDDFAIIAATIMANLGALVAARELFLAGHSATGDGVFAGLAFHL